jgi:hypothetical protein
MLDDALGDAPLSDIDDDTLEQPIERMVGPTSHAERGQVPCRAGIPADGGDEGLCRESPEISPRTANIRGLTVEDRVRQFPRGRGGMEASQPAGRAVPAGGALVLAQRETDSEWPGTSSTGRPPPAAGPGSDSRAHGRRVERQAAPPRH